MNQNRLKILFFALLMTGSLTSFAKFPGVLSRSQVGYTFVSNKATYSSMYRTNILNIDTSFADFDMKTSASFGITAGTYFPLSRLGNSSALVLGVDFMFNNMVWETEVPGFSESGFKMKFQGLTSQFVLPVGLDLKFGADAVQARDRRLCATVGAGVYPSYAMTVMEGSVLTLDPVLSVAPYVKAEVGIYAGVCMKVRAIYAIGDVVYMDYQKSVSEMGITAESALKLTSKSNLALSLIVMPFSFKWKTQEWWNTY